MRIADLLQMINDNALTCSIVAQLFAESPYAQQGELVPDGDGKKRYPTPHGHMHIREGLEILPPAQTASAARLLAWANLKKEMKKKVWEESYSQLYPEPTNVQVYATAEQQVALKDSNDVGIDKNMLAFDHSYNRRSGVQLTGVAAVTRTDHYLRVPVMGKKGKPDRVLAPDQATPMLLATWLGTPYHARLAQEGVSKDGVINEYWRDKPDIVIISPMLPKIDSNPHSMFEDSESAIMTLTAALKSKAGVKVLEALVGQTRSVSFAIQSCTAVRALHATVNSKTGSNPSSTHSKRDAAVKMIDRAQTLGADRSFTGIYTQTPRDITFTCTILSLVNTNELLIVSHYPLAGEMTNKPSSVIGECDLAETSQTPDGGVFVDVPIDNPLPALVW